MSMISFFPTMKKTGTGINFALLACSGNFTGVSRSQRSRAYLISFNEKIKRAAVLNRKQTPVFVKV